MFGGAGGNAVAAAADVKSDVYGYRSCPDCGTTVQRSRLDGHTCGPERFLAHQTLKARWGLERLEDDLDAWLATPAGEFQAYLARRGGS
jgi:hypothetical protein